MDASYPSDVVGDEAGNDLEEVWVEKEAEVGDGGRWIDFAI